jgi:hypothetical protein
MKPHVSVKGLVAAVTLFTVGVAMHEAARAESIKDACWLGQHWNSFTKQCEPDLCLPPKKMIDGQCVLPKVHTQNGGNVQLSKCTINPELTECKPCPQGYKKVNGKCIKGSIH